MACFHPNHVVSSIVDGVGVHTRFLGSAGLVTSKDLYFKNPAEFHMLVPCGHCMGCRLDRARVWADRMLIELADNDYKAIFVTLTYDEAHVPFVHPLKPGYYFVPDGGYHKFEEEELWVPDAYGAYKGSRTLSVRDTQLFFKRLRKAFPGRRIRYFLAGEYGPKTQRPHYHAIIFGLSLSDFEDLCILKFNDLGQPLYKSEFFLSIWKNGHCSLACVNWNTCSYVARYTMKKLYKDDDPSAYSDGRKPPFCTMSRRPGIGLMHAFDLLQKGDRTFVRDEHGVHEVYLGRPFLRSALNGRIKDIVAVSNSSLEVDIESFSAVKALYERQSKRAYNSFMRSYSCLASANKNVMENFRGKEKYFLDRLKLLPERRSLFEEASTSKPPD